MTRAYTRRSLEQQLERLNETADKLEARIQASRDKLEILGDKRQRLVNKQTRIQQAFNEAAKPSPEVPS